MNRDHVQWSVDERDDDVLNELLEAFNAGIPLDHALRLVDEDKAMRAASQEKPTPV